jgi:hypothetical protein
MANVRAEDTEAILMGRNGIIVFQGLNKFNSVGYPEGKQPKAFVAGDILWPSGTGKTVSE